jgi:hypothetical protein
MIDDDRKPSDMEEKIKKLKVIVDQFNQNDDNEQILERFSSLSVADHAEISDTVKSPIIVLEHLMEVILLFQEHSRTSSLEISLLKNSSNGDKSKTEDDKILLSQILTFAVTLFHEKFFIQYWLYLFLSTSSINNEDQANQNIFLDRMKYLFYCQKKLSNFYYSSFSNSSLTSAFDLSTSPIISYQIFFFHVTNSFLIAIKDFLQKSNNSNNSNRPLPKEISFFFDFFDSSLLRKFISFLLFHESVVDETSTGEESGLPQIEELIEGEEQVVSLSHHSNNQIFLLKSELLFVWNHLVHSINNYKLIIQCIEILFQQNEKKKKNSYDIFTINEKGEDSIGLSILLSLFSQFLAVISSSSSLSLSEDNNSTKKNQEYEYLHLFIQKIILKYSFSSLLISSLFSSSHSSLVSPTLTFPHFSKSYQRFLFVTILDIWGNSFFHNNGNLSLFESYSRLLSYLIKDWKQEDLHLDIQPFYLNNHNNNDPNVASSPILLESLLINAISNGLECSVPLVRIHTMKIAIKYAEIMNYPLEFDELKEYEAMESKASSSSLIEEKPKEIAGKGETEMENKKQEDQDDDSDDEEEIQGYLLSKENDCIIGDIADSKTKVYYLRNCIESRFLFFFFSFLPNMFFFFSFSVLTKPEGTPDLRQMIILALVSCISILYFYDLIVGTLGKYSCYCC